MGLKSFLKLVEIKTKAASMTPFLLGTVFVLYRYQKFNWVNFLLMLVSLLCFDMATTAINNYLDYKKARKTEGFGYEEHNAIVRDNLSEFSVLTVIVILLILAVGFGILLFLNTSPVVLILGIISFSVGILYTFGPVPISRMPLGEVFSGFFMGFVILFLSVYIHLNEGALVELIFRNWMLNLNFNVKEILVLFLVSFPAFMGISNIMLANNICDMEDDWENRRYTLPLYIGREKALALFQVIYYASYLDILLLLVLNILPVTTIPALFTIFPVRNNISRFLKLQNKRDTFPVAIQNFLLINVSLILFLLPALFLR
ncbi:MAG: 1,4-dihydroxy-2-naphthoate polyprenyltransferase [Clostridiales bacterium]|nr:1,4-dihydroxy-2-naphthoate polyprenyltransferase [Clostridiales bacterium]